MAEQKTSLDELKQEMEDFLEKQKKIQISLKEKAIEEITKQVSAFIKMYGKKDQNEIDGFELTLDEETNRFSDDGDSYCNVLMGLTKDGQYEYVQIYSSVFGGDESDPIYDSLSNLSIGNLVEILELFPLEVNVLSEEEEEE